MWGRRIAARVTATVMVAIAVATTSVVRPSWAAGPGDPFYGDLDGDRLTDRVTLAVAPPDRCMVQVQRGRPGGRYLKPQTYSYPEPGGNAVGACPDMGVIVDLGGDGMVELALAWFGGAPPGVDIDLLVLRDFTPTGGFTAIFQPSFVGLAEFNGDGRKDLYEWTDQGEGFRTYLNTPGSRLEPGPVRWCSGRPQFELGDFHRNGRMDVAIAYPEGCGDFSTGVVVVRDDGSPVHLERDALGDQWWTVDVLDCDGDRLLDVRTDNMVTHEVTHYIGTGDGTFVESPQAVADRVHIRDGRAAHIRILANDRASRAATVSITVPPSYGRVRLTSNRTVIYTPWRTPPDGADRFVYRLVQDGKQSTTSVSVRFLG